MKFALKTGSFFANVIVDLKKMKIKEVIEDLIFLI